MSHRPLKFKDSIIICCDTINHLTNSTLNNTIDTEVNNMNNIVTANDLKTRGVSIIDEITSDCEEAVITVRGEHKYIVLTLAEYNHLRECELEAAIIESEKDIKDGRYVKESVEDHIKRITSA